MNRSLKLCAYRTQVIEITLAPLGLKNARQPFNALRTIRKFIEPEDRGRPRDSLRRVADPLHRVRSLARTRSTSQFICSTSAAIRVT